MQDNSDLIIRDCCEAEAAEFGKPDTICITVDVLREIVQRHFPGTCLHQIQEPAAAEQAAWHAGLDEGRAQAAGSVSNATSQAAPAAVAAPALSEEALKRLFDGMHAQHADRTALFSPFNWFTAGATMAEAALAATPAAVQTHAEAAAALCINSALTRIRAGNHAEAIEPLEHALRALGTTTAAAAPVELPQPVATLHCNDECYVWARASEAGQRMRFEQPIALFTEQQLRAQLATATGLPAQADVADEVNCVCGASWLRHGTNNYEMTDTPRKAKSVPVAVTTADELAKLSGENAGSKMATVFHPESSGFPVKLYAAPQAQADARDAEQEVLMEHSGCGSNTQVDMLTVRLNPGDKVVMHKGRITQGFDRANRAAIAAAKGE